MTLICDIKYIINPYPPEKVKSPSKLKPQWTWSWGDWFKSLVLRVLSCFSSNAAKELSELNASYQTDLPPPEAQAKAKAERIRSQVLGARREILNEVWIVNHKPMRSIEAIVAGTNIEANAAIERLVSDDSVWPEGDIRSSGDLRELVRPIIYSNGRPNWKETDRHTNGKIGFIPECRYALTGAEIDRRPDLNELPYDLSPKRPTPVAFQFDNPDICTSLYRGPNRVRTFNSFYESKNDEVALLNKDALKARLLASSSEEVS